MGGGGAANVAIPSTPRNGGHNRVPLIYCRPCWGMGTFGWRVMQVGATVSRRPMQRPIQTSPPGLVYTVFGDRDARRGGTAGVPVVSPAASRRGPPSFWSHWGPHHIGAAAFFTV